MAELEKISMRLFSDISEKISFFFPDLRTELRVAGIRLTPQEYLAKSLFVSFLAFLISMPLLSFILSFFLSTFLFGFITSVTFSIAIALVVFIIYINRPKSIISQKRDEIDKSLPFLTLNLASIAGSRLQLTEIFRIFYKFSGTGETGRQIKQINDDIYLLGLDINTALERAVERCPSKNLKEILWGILSMNRTGGDIVTFLKEKSANLMLDYKRKLSEFSRQITIYIEIYLTLVVIGAIFFTILTSIMSGLGGGTSENIIVLQSFLVFIFIPAISAAFVFLIKKLTPSWE
jgi:flagellar protein FlaJ